VLRHDRRRTGTLLLSTPPLRRRLLAEGCGTAFLVTVVVGSGIAAERLSTDLGLRLLENAAATAGGLVALILALGPVSGAHFNPVVSLVAASFGGLDWRDVPPYAAAQVAGAVIGAVIANLMFELDAISWSTHERSSGGLWLGEVVATVGLLVVIFGVVRSGRSARAAVAVGAYIGGAYFFTSSTSFANPAVTVGRAFTDSFAGIQPASVPAFVGAQLLGGALAVLLVRALYPSTIEVDDDAEPQLERHP
jgi:arsenate reductase